MYLLCYERKGVSEMERQKYTISDESLSRIKSVISGDRIETINATQTITNARSSFCTNDEKRTIDLLVSYGTLSENDRKAVLSEVLSLIDERFFSISIGNWLPYSGWNSAEYRQRVKEASDGDTYYLSGRNNKVYEKGSDETEYAHETYISGSEGVIEIKYTKGESLSDGTWVTRLDLDWIRKRALCLKDLITFFYGVARSDYYYVFIHKIRSFGVIVELLNYNEVQGEGIMVQIEEKRIERERNAEELKAKEEERKREAEEKKKEAEESYKEFLRREKREKIRERTLISSAIALTIIPLVLFFSGFYSFVWLILAFVGFISFLWLNDYYL